MNMHVLLENKPEDGYTATLLGWPDMVAQGATEAEALANLRQTLHTRLANAKVVSLEVELSSENNPWLQLTEMFQDDPFYEEMQAEIAAYRQELDAQDSTV